MPRKIAVIPGILGSILSDYQEPKPRDLWGENLIANYRSLCKHPTRLDWVGTRARSRLLKTVRVFRVFGHPIYEKLTKHVKSLPEVSEVIECSYDWRESVLASCETVAKQIAAHVSGPLDKAPPPGAEKVVIVAHSLGGLVAKAAIAQQLIHPGRIESVFYIGCPQYGAPAAFRSMYDDVDLPFFHSSPPSFGVLKSTPLGKSS